jgi:16S rRNA (guanine527-N7)-methyltransferase
MPGASLGRLIEEPIRAARLFPEGPVTWFDLGSGAGSPAIPIKVVRPAARLTMVESRSRKAAFLREAIRTTQLEGASVLACRVEQLSTWTGSSVDVFTVRAVRIDPGIAQAIVFTASPAARVLLFGPADWTALHPHFMAELSDGRLTVLQRMNVPRGTTTA